MRPADDVIVDLAVLPRRGMDVPYGRLLAALLRARLEPDACERALAQANAQLAEPLLRPEGVRDGGMLVHAPLLFPEQVDFRFVLETRGGRWAVPLTREEVAPVAAFLRTLGPGVAAGQVRELWPFGADGVPEALLAPAPVPRDWPEDTGPGLYRREHASLLVRSDAVGVLVDPIPLQRRLPGIGGAPGSAPRVPVAALAVTHGHVDHWHLPSLLSHLPHGEVPVLVPHVPRPSLLTFQDFADALAACGQRAVSPAWGGWLQVGDIRVDVLPFYGEQPASQGRPLLEGLRNWGNCYRFTTPDFSCLVLVDSGMDPDGDMESAVAASCRELGPVDVVLACQRAFHAPFFGGLSHYWAALPYAQLRELFEEWLADRLRSATASPEGVADVCVAAGARYFLPYANGFEGVGQPVTDVGWGDGEPAEAECNARVRARLAERGATTQVLDWSPGGAARFRRGALELTPGV